MVIWKLLGNLSKANPGGLQGDATISNEGTPSNNVVMSTDFYFFSSLKQSNYCKGMFLRHKSITQKIM